MPPADLTALTAALDRLDERLAVAVAAMDAAPGRTRIVGSQLAQYLLSEDADELLGRSPLTPAFELHDPRSLAPADDPAFAQLARAFDLEAFDLDVVMLALAPELDARYERIFGFLADDLTTRRPTVDVALSVLATARPWRIEARTRLTQGPLALEGIVTLAGESAVPSRELRLDDAIVSWLLTGQSAAVWPEPEVAAGTERATAAAIAAVRALPPPVRIELAGEPGCGQRAVASAVAAALARPLLEAQASDAVAADRLARLEDAVLFLHGEPAFPLELGAACVLTTFPVPDAVEIGVQRPRLRARRAAWSTALASLDALVDDTEIDQIAGRFRLTLDDIRTAARDAVRRAAAAGRDPGVEDLFAAARRRSSGSLDGLATRIVPARSWADLVLTEDHVARLRELCDAVAGRSQVLEEWGFADKLSSGHGVTALFSGAPGTGKTLAAEVVANELGLDLFRIDLAGVVSKYIGETEKNLDAIFAAAEGATAVLLFDEADALFGKRSEVHDAHDRFANIEISYLLQKMEVYDGVAILATNLKENLDEAFLRRLAFVVWFGEPGEAERLRMWRNAWPAATPLTDDVDVEWLAGEYRLTGGSIRNIAVAAASLAAAGSESVGLRHVLRATVREFEKSGKALAPQVLEETAA